MVLPIAGYLLSCIVSEKEVGLGDVSDLSCLEFCLRDGVMTNMTI